MIVSTAGCPCSLVDSIIVPSSPLQDQIGTNYAPTIFERKQTEATLANFRQDLIRLESVLTYLHAVQERLQLKRDALQKRADAHAALLSPIRRVPLEILAEIFLYFLPEDDRNNTPDARRQRMLPSHICVRWRDLSLSTPSFWADISVVVDGEDNSRKLECAKCWLARSGNCGLKIYISTMEDSAQQWQSLVNIVLPYCRRWIHATILSGTFTDLSAIKPDLPMLESLDILLTTQPSNSPFQFTPRLYRLRADVNQILTKCILPWNQLTHIDMIYGSVRQTLTGMQKLPNVVSYSAQMFPPSDHTALEPLGYAPTRLKHLECLDLTVLDINITGFHECLDLPALTEYTYIEGGCDTGWTIPSILSLISRSFCVLQRIEIELVNAVGQDDLALLLRLTPDLKSLGLNCRRSTGINSNMVLDQLLITPSSTSPLVPKLNGVFLNYDRDFSFPLLMDMIRSRWKIDERTTGTLKNPFATVEVWNVDQNILDQELVWRLCELEADGLVRIRLMGRT